MNCTYCSIFGSHQQSFSRHASSIPHSEAMIPGALGPGLASGPPAAPSVSHPPLSRHRQNSPVLFPGPWCAPRAKSPQVGTKAGPSPGAPALSGPRWGWAVAAAPPGKARTR